MKHVVILVDNQTNTKLLVDKLIGGHLNTFDTTLNEKIGVFSADQIEQFIEEEEYHNLKIITRTSKQSLKSMSSGEQKKALLDYLLKQELDCLLLINPYDNLDIKTQSELKSRFEKIGKSKQLVQILSRTADILALATTFYSFSNETLRKYSDVKDFQKNLNAFKINFETSIPPPLEPTDLAIQALVEFKKVSVNFDGNQVLNCIDWTIKKSEFWELAGPNGSGKSTLLTMITGDSPKSYKQDLTLFGRKKASGESVWDIKKSIGYFTPAMTDKFRGYHTLESMLISGLHDSVGLYVKPSDKEIQLARAWLELINLGAKKDHYFHELSIGEKRLLMITRAMIKHPPLLILDEPTAGLDDITAKFFVDLVNKFAKESKSAIIFVSHRKEPGLKANKVFKLIPTTKGSEGRIFSYT